jgi:hypothetical protein
MPVHALLLYNLDPIQNFPQKKLVGGAETFFKEKIMQHAYECNLQLSNFI